MDLGNYERYLSLSLTGDNNITTGKIYLHVISQERKGAYLGRTVQIVPHVVDAIKEWITRVAHTCVDGSGEEPDVCIIEMGYVPIVVPLNECHLSTTNFALQWPRAY